jgi:hypothetical protein
MPDPWLTPDEVRGLNPVPEPLEKALSWIENFIAQPHPDLGRTGAVCPFVPGALELQTLYLRAEPAAKTAKQVNAIVDEALKDFAALPPTDEREVQFKSLIMVFPGVPRERAKEVIDAVQRQRKPDFIEQCLMIGQFHELNETPAVHNPNFYAFQSPVPMLAVRVLVATDNLFMTLPEYSLDEQFRFLAGYYRCLQSRPAYEKRKAEVYRAMRELAEELRKLAEESRQKSGQ